MKNLTPYQKAALDYSKHISLTANAGSGKTFVFTKRFLETLLQNDIELENVIAITFTDKAAGELYSKISEEIEKRIKVEQDNRIKRRLESLRRGLVSANISTIHSFCIDILRENAPDAHIDANFITIDNSVANELIELSIEELLKNFYRKHEFESEIKYLLRYFGSKNLLINELRAVINKRRGLFKLSEQIYSKDVHSVSELFNQTFEHQFKRIILPEIKKNLKKIETINDFVKLNSPPNEIVEETDKIIKNLYAENKIDFIVKSLNRIYELVFTKAGDLKTRGYLASKFRTDFDEYIFETQKFFKSIKNLFELKNEKQITLELAKFGKIFSELSLRLIEIYQKKKSEKAYLDFEDILINTENLISKEEIQLQLSKKYKYVMIDEYQDTNETQYNIFMPILNHLKSGNLFVVGDEKQSIYMFRNAELEIFNKTKKELLEEKAKGDTLILPHSFRLAPNIAAFTNELFKNLMINPNIEFNEVVYSELICARKEMPAGEIEILISDEENESELVARKILELRNKKINLKDIAVLCRKRSAFAELEKAFVKYKISYNIVGGKGFYQQQIILDLSNYLSFLINPKNDTSLVGLLRSPFFFLSDKELFLISLEKANSFYDKLKEYSKKKGKFVEIVRLLETNILQSQRISLTKLIRKIFSESTYWSILASKSNSDQELANLNKLISIANNFSQQSFSSLYDFVNYLNTSIEMSDDESQAIITASQDAVNIMTLHKAKGLEFKAVFLFKCHESSQDNSAKSKKIVIDKHLGIMTKVPVNGHYFEAYQQAPITWLSDYVQKRKNYAELIRVLYVGITRAEEYLYITATKGKREFSDDSFIGMIFGALRKNIFSDRLKLRSKLTFMKAAEDDYSLYEKELVVEILINNSTTNQVGIPSAEIKQYDIKEIYTDKIFDFEKNEIISATKITVYSQCPLKYKLTYELGYSKLFKMQKKFEDLYEFNLKEDDEIKIFSDVRGRIIHQILEKQVVEHDLKKCVEDLINSEVNLNNVSLAEKDNLSKKILTDLRKFYSSQIYSKLQSFSKYYNEFEVYAKEKDYFLYGIIDKLIVDKDKLIIVDYKSDVIKQLQVKRKAAEYFIQLKFYAFVLSKLFENINLFELRLIFISHSDLNLSMLLNLSEVNEFGLEISEYVQEIRNKDFSSNSDHCKNCHFSSDGKNCVVIS